MQFVVKWGWRKALQPLFYGRLIAFRFILTYKVSQNKLGKQMKTNYSYFSNETFSRRIRCISSNNNGKAGYVIP